MVLLRFAFVVLALPAVAAFSPIALQGNRGVTFQREFGTVAHQAQPLSDVDTMCVMNTADYCSEEEEACDIQEEDALMNSLESQAHYIEIRLDEIEDLMSGLSGYPQSNDLRTLQTNHQVLSEIDTLCLMNTASYCIEEGCSEEDHEALLNTLYEQYGAWNMRLVEIISSLNRLYHHHSHAPTPNNVHEHEIDSLMESIRSRLSTDDSVPESVAQDMPIDVVSMEQE